MKFDKFMEISFRILAGFTAALVLLGSIVSCSSFKASAAGEIDAAETIITFRDQAIQNFQTLEESVLTDIRNGNLDSTSALGRQILLAVAVQQIAITCPPIGDIYNAAEIIAGGIPSDFFTDNPTTSIGGTSLGVGTYQSRLDWKYHSVTLFPVYGLGDYVVARSDEFEIHNVYTLSSGSTFNSCVPYFQSTSSRLEVGGHFYLSGLVDVRSYDAYTLNYFQAFRGTNFGNNWIEYNYLEGTSIPLLTYYVAGSDHGKYGALAMAYDLTQETIDTYEPWEYYNNLIQDFRNTYPDVDNNYFIFPDGYTPPADPIVDLNVNNVNIAPPIILGAGAIVAVGGVNFDVFVPISASPQMTIDGIDFQFPKIDNDVHRVWIDSQPYEFPTPEIEVKGHTVEVPEMLKLIIDGVEFVLTEDPTLLINDLIEMSLPVGTPSQTPSEAYDYEYYFPTETLADIRLPDTTLPVNSALPSSIVTSMPLIWQYIYDILDASGINTVLPFLLGLGVCGYVVYKLGS